MQGIIGFFIVVILICSNLLLLEKIEDLKHSLRREELLNKELSNANKSLKYLLEIERAGGGK